MVMANVLYSKDEIIRILEDHEFDKLSFVDGYGHINVEGYNMEVSVQAQGEVISDEIIELAVKGLNKLDECIESAYKWISLLKDAEGGELDIIGICFERVRRGYESGASEILGFSIWVHLDGNDISRDVIVYFSENSLLYGQAYAIEEALA